jgi:two-component system phosphate regulon sensor histidine kinase PhoR
MKQTPFTPPLIALFVALALSLLSAPLLWLLGGEGVTGLILLALQTLLAWGITWGVLRWLVYRRLHRIYDRLLQIRQQRLPAYPTYRQRDPITGINRTILELTGTLREELNELREMELIRQEFIGDVSHELKTPIFAIQGFLETLLDGALDDPGVNQQFLEKALSNTYRLNNLVQDLLIVSKLEAGQIKMEREPVRIYELILDVAQSLEYKAQHDRKGQPHITVYPGPFEKSYVLADKQRIQQVLTNLIDNAIKYGDEQGNVTIELNDAGEKLKISITDYGQGISEEHLPHIFDRFYRVDKSRVRKSGGSGLGLSIVKNLIEAHGEQIEADSRPGQTTFTFTLPLTEH